MLVVLGGEALVDGGDELAKLGLVLALDLSQGQHGSGLLMNDSAEAGLALDDGVRDAHLAAESGKEDNQLDRVDVVGDQDQRSLLGFDEADNVVETILHCVGFLDNLRVRFVLKLYILALRLGTTRGTKCIPWTRPPSSCPPGQR